MDLLKPLIALSAVVNPVGVLPFEVFRLSGGIARLIGRTGIHVMTRPMGLILAALPVEIMADGQTQLFSILASRGPA